MNLWATAAMIARKDWHFSLFPALSSGDTSPQYIYILLAIFGLILIFWLGFHLRNKIRKQRDRKYTHFDALTGLPNWEEMQLEMKRRGEGAFAVFEIKYFKAYNELLGYEVGDKLLKAIADKLTSLRGQGIYAARLQSASFAVLMPKDSKTVVQEKLAAILELAGRGQGESDFAVRFACGAAFFRKGEDANHVLDNANFARQSAKDSIGTEVVFFDEETHIQFTEFVDDAGMMLKGGTGDLVVAYQPKYSLKSGRLIGCEALIRWQHPQRGLLLPGEFLPALEQAGSIRRVDFFVLRQSLWQMASWRSEGLSPPPVAINISRVQFTNLRLAEELLEVLAEYGVPPALVQLETTENALEYDEGKALQLMARLKQSGFSLALDDFGAGLSSLTHLANMPVDTVNLDRDFLNNVVNNPARAHLVKDVVRLIHDLGRTAMIKGVESAEQAQVAREINGDTVQGFYFGQPMSASEFTALLRAQYAGVAAR